MPIRRWTMVFVLANCFIGCASQDDGAVEFMKHPLADLPIALEIDDEAVRAYAETVATSGADADDPNAELWTDVGTADGYESLDGEWASRWSLDGKPWNPGDATIQTVGDRVFIRFLGAGTDYLIDSVRRGDRLVGRYVHRRDVSDTEPWVGIVVSNERIDGYWPKGRWDFRRGPAELTSSVEE